jgi:hypothetical protein
MQQLPPAATTKLITAADPITCSNSLNCKIMQSKFSPFDHSTDQLLETPYYMQNKNWYIRKKPKNGLNTKAKSSLSLSTHTQIHTKAFQTKLSLLQKLHCRQKNFLCPKTSCRQKLSHKNFIDKKGSL